MCTQLNCNWLLFTVKWGHTRSYLKRLMMDQDKENSSLSCGQGSASSPWRQIQRKWGGGASSQRPPRLSTKRTTKLVVSWPNIFTPSTLLTFTQSTLTLIFLHSSLETTFFAHLSLGQHYISHPVYFAHFSLDLYWHWTLHIVYINH